ncbi:hypothetical protein LguiA_018202 [Lonicera macranthoides]
MLKSEELYSVTVLKSWNRRFIHSLRALGKMTNFWWSYLSFRDCQRPNGSSSVMYSFFKSS